MFLPHLLSARILAFMTSAHDRQFRKSLAAAVLLSAAFVMPAQAQMPAALSMSAEFPAETAAIVQATSELFDAVEGGTKPRGKRPVVTAPIIATPASFRIGAARADVLTSRGAVDHLTGYRISWYPVDRFLGTVDFMGTWNGNRDLVCGYVTWDLSDPDKPVLEDIQANFVKVADLSRQDDEAIHGTLLDANCAYGAIEANYAFFE